MTVAAAGAVEGAAASETATGSGAATAKKAASSSKGAARGGAGGSAGSGSASRPTSSSASAPASSGGRSFPAVQPSAAVDSGAGFVLGVLVWCWVGLPFLRGGMTEVRNVLRAKFFNKGADGSWLP